MPNSKGRKNLTASLSHEIAQRAHGYRSIVGIDEAGRGPWAGPLMAAAVALPLDRPDLPEAVYGVRDSKQLSERQRTRMAADIRQIAVAWGVGSASAHEIGTAGLTQATKLAMQRALDMLRAQFPTFMPDFLLLDFMKWPETDPLPKLNLTQGDRFSLSIAAASILAKTTRDAYMLDLDTRYPEYGFKQHKGYGTAAHRAALARLGPTPEHRASFAPIRALLDAQSGS